MTKDEKEIRALVSEEYVAQPAEPIEWEVGRHYQGSFWLNDFGEIQVRAAQKGTKPGNMRKQVEGERHVIYASNNLVRVVITLERDTKENLRRKFAQACTEAIVDLVSHDFRPIKKTTTLRQNSGTNKTKTKKK